MMFFMKLKSLGVEIKHIGTDEEAAIMNAITKVYPNCNYLLCWRHFIGSLERKLVEIGVPFAKRTTVKALFTGQNDINGLLDSRDIDHFNEQWSIVKSKLISLLVNEKYLKLINYIECKSSILKHLLVDVRARANIIGPWYSNNAESINHKFKADLSHKMSYSHYMV